METDTDLTETTQEQKHGEYLARLRSVSIRLREDALVYSQGVKAAEGASATEEQEALIHWVLSLHDQAWAAYREIGYQARPVEVKMGSRRVRWYTHDPGDGSPRPGFPEVLTEAVEVRDDAPAPSSRPEGPTAQAALDADIAQEQAEPSIQLQTTDGGTLRVSGYDEGQRLHLAYTAPDGQAGKAVSLYREEVLTLIAQLQGREELLQLYAERDYHVQQMQVHAAREAELAQALAVAYDQQLGRAPSEARPV